MEDRKMKPRPRKGRRKVCQFCVDKVEHINYKDAENSASSSLSAVKSCPAV